MRRAVPCLAGLPAFGPASLAAIAMPMGLVEAGTAFRRRRGRTEL